MLDSNRAPRAATLAMAIALLGGCGDEPDPSPPADEGPPSSSTTPTTPTVPPVQPVSSDPPGPAMPADFAFSIGTGGGVSGAWETSQVAADGAISISSDGRPTPAGQLTPAGRQQVWRRLNAVGFFDWSGEPGNMSTRITVTAGGRQTSVAHWMGAGPPAFRRLEAYLRRVLAARDAVALPPAGDPGPIAVSLEFIGPTGVGERPDGPVAPEGWRCLLVVTVHNVSDEALRVPSGLPAHTYMDLPFGLEIVLGHAEGRHYSPDPGAGGPVLPLTDEFFTRLEPGQTLACRVAIGSWICRDAPEPILWRTPGRFKVRARWACPEGTEPMAAGELDPMEHRVGADSPVWHGASAWQVFEFDLP